MTEASPMPGRPAAGSSSDREIVITRVFNAPRKQVWRAWTEPEAVAQWWGPRGFSTRVTRLELRPGGRWDYVMIGPDGAEYPVTGVFREIIPYERIVTSDEFGDEYKAAAAADLPDGIVLTCLFEDDGPGRTRLTLRIGHPTVEERRKHEEMGVVPGWGSSLDCLEEYLAGKGAK